MAELHDTPPGGGDKDALELAALLDEWARLHDRMLGREEPDLGEERRFWRLTSVAMQRVVRTMDRAALTGGHLSPTPMAARLIEFAAAALHSGSKGNLPVAWERPGKRSVIAERVNAAGFAAAYYLLCAAGVVPDPDPKGTVAGLFRCGRSTAWTFVRKPCELQYAAFLREFQEKGEVSKEAAERLLTRAGREYRRGGVGKL